MYLLATRDRGWMRQCEAALLAGGIESRWAQTEDNRAVLLDVPTTDAERAAAVLSALLEEDLKQPRRLIRPVGSIAAQPAFAVAFGLATLALAFFWVTGAFDLGKPWFREGALITSFVWQGEWWRVITAATLHVDAGHALGNSLFLVFLGWAVAERLGGGMMLVLVLVTATAGFFASLLLADIHATMGASGGLFGLLGVAAGHGLRRQPMQLGRRRHILRVAGAALMLLAFTAFGPKANIHAHLGGFAAGLGCGFLLPPHGFSRLAQIGLAFFAGAVVAGAWWVALR